MKKALWIAGGIVLAIIVAAASFYGGMAYQRSQATSVQARFFASRGLNSSATGNLPAGGRGFGGITGSVKSIDGNVLTISTPQNVLTVNLSGTTKILKASNGSAADITVGQEVVVSVQRENNSTTTGNGGTGGLGGTGGNGSTGGNGGNTGPFNASQVLIMPSTQ